MDRITKALLTDFTKENALDALPEDEQFEHFAAFLTTRRHYSRALDTNDVVIGSGGDTGIDSISVIANGALVTDFDQVKELEEQNGYLEVLFVLTQAERSSNFDSGKIAKFGAGVSDLFSEEPKLVQNAKIKEAASIIAAIYELSSSFRKRPSCRLYYVTTGKVTDDKNILAQREAVTLRLKETEIFDSVEFACLGADEVRKFYNQTKKAVSREFVFEEKVEIPSPPGVEVAFLGFLPARTFVSLIANEAGDAIMGNIFYDNVRDWQDYNLVNSEIRATLRSEVRGRFVLMNNGVTIIAKKLKQSGKKFFIEDFQIVNGCQTSHVLFDQKDIIDDTVFVPVRLIWSENDEVIESIVRATNRQTELKPEQLYALTDFAKKLEEYFSALEGDKLYYERRDGQFDQMAVEKSRIVTPPSLIKAFASMFLSEPHTATKNYKKLREDIGRKIFGKDHRLEPYHVAALTAYKLEQQFRSKKLGSEYKSARHHILMALRYLMDPKPIGLMNSHDVERRCKAMLQMLSAQPAVDGLMQKAKLVIDDVCGGNLARDNVRTQATTEAIDAKLRKK